MNELVRAHNGGFGPYRPSGEGLNLMQWEAQVSSDGSNRDLEVSAMPKEPIGR